VDTFRLLAVFFVVVVNTQYPNLPEHTVAWVKLALRWAIPFFFILNGYFLASRSERTKSLDIRAAVERLAWIFLVWNLIYLPLEIWGDGLNLRGVFDLLSAPLFLFTGSYHHLWLISSLLFGYLFIAILNHYNAKRILPIVSIVSLAIGLLGGGYQIFKLGFVLGFNIPRFWLSIPFLYMGWLTYRGGYFAWWVAVLLIVFGAALQIFEAQVLYTYFWLPLDNRQFLLGTILLAYGMAWLALANVSVLWHPLLAKWGREYSLGIYLIHPLINIVLVYALLYAAPVVATNPILQALFPLVVFSLSTAAVIATGNYAPAVYNFLLGIRAPAQSSSSSIQ
jgi:surface polysaccharide O-acyltransferase-like enzyme